MNASKEACKQAQAELKSAVGRLGVELGSINDDAFKYIQMFLEAAERKLPSEAAFEREKSRSRSHETMTRR